MGNVGELLGLWPLAAVLAAFAGFFGWVLYTPAADAPRIKRDYEGPGRHVSTIRRAGYWAGGRSQPWYRTYDVTIDAIGKPSEQRRVGVEVTFFSDPGLAEFDGSFFGGPKRIRGGD
jgi:hypothetical protein